MTLGEMEHDRACLEQGEIAFLIGWNLAERMKAQMRRLLHRTKRNKANLVGLAHFFKRPANACITRQPLAAIGRPFKGGNDDGHPWTLAECDGALVGRPRAQPFAIGSGARSQQIVDAQHADQVKRIAD